MGTNVTLSWLFYYTELIKASHPNPTSPTHNREYHLQSIYKAPGHFVIWNSLLPEITASGATSVIGGYGLSHITGSVSASRSRTIGSEPAPVILCLYL